MTPARWMAANKAAVRYESAPDSDEVCQLKKGEIITVTHTKEVTSQGQKTTRLRFNLGWVSQVNTSGYTLCFVSPRVHKLHMLYIIFARTACRPTA